MQAVERSLARLALDDKELARQREEVTQELGARYDEVLRWVNRSRDELLETMAATADSALAGLRAEEKAATVTMDTLSDLVSRAARVSGSNPDVLLLKNELRGALLGEESVDNYRKLGDREEQKTFLQLKADSSVLDLGVVRAYVGELSSGGTAPPGLSLWQQVQAMKDGATALEEKLKTAEEQLRQLSADNTAALEAKIQSIQSRTGKYFFPHGF